MRSKNLRTISQSVPITKAMVKAGATWLKISRERERPYSDEELALEVIAAAFIAQAGESLK